MPHRKLRIVAHRRVVLPQPQAPGLGRDHCVDGGAGLASAKENLRLLKAFSRIDDDRQRAWLLELVEHLAGLDAPTH